MYRVKITGYEKLRERLKELSSPKKYDEIMREVVDEAVRLAKAYAPRDTGRLEESIKGVKTGECKYSITTNVPYAIWNEFGSIHTPAGTVENPLSVVSTSGKFAYRPFLRPASIHAVKNIMNKIKIKLRKK